MPFNVNTRSITHFLGVVAFESHGVRNIHYQALRNNLCHALQRPLARELSNQTTPRNLTTVWGFVPNEHPEWVKHALEQGKTIYDFHPGSPLIEDIFHVADWLTAAYSNQEPWLSHVDAKGRPYKLLKLGSVGQVVREADKAMARYNNGTVKALNENDIGTVKTFPDGARIVQLYTTRALDAESRAMGHCVGHGAYDNRLSSDTHRYFSLRSKTGKACATMEVRNNENALLQCKGRQNEPPVAKYMPYIHAFVTEKQFKLLEHPRYTGLIEQDARYYDIANLPPKLTWKSDLDLSGTAVQRLPEDLTIHGHLHIEDTGLNELPKRLTVHGDIYASASRVQRVPPCLQVRGTLNIAHTRVAEIPPGLTVGKNLAAHSSLIRTIGPGLRIGGHLVLSDTPLEKLPDNLTIPGQLYLVKSKIRQLPKNLTCQALDLSNSAIETLPPCLTVNRGPISLANTRLKSFPDNFSAPSFVDLSGATVDKLPQRMAVGRGFIIDHATRLPSIPPYMSGKLRREALKPGDWLHPQQNAKIRAFHRRTDQEQEQGPAS